MQQHLGQPQGTGHSAGQLTRSAAVGHQHTTADVVATAERHLLDRRGHRFHRQLEGPFRQLLRRTPQHLRQGGEALLHHLRVGPLVASSTEHRREPLHLQTTQQQIGVGHRERTATAITGRTWHRTRRARADREPIAIAVDDRTATGCHGVNGQAWRQQMQACHLRFGAAFPDPISRTCWQTEHIGAGAAHIEPHQGPLLQASPAGHRHRTHHASGRSGQDRVFRQQTRRRLQGTAGGHHPQTGMPTEGPSHLIEIVEQRTGHRGLHQGGLPPGHQTGQGTDPMGTHHRGEAEAAHKRLELAFMLRIAPGMQQRDGTTPQPLALVLTQPLLQALIKLQGGDFPAIGINTPRHLLHRRGQKGRRRQLKGKQIWPVLITDTEQIRQTGVGEQQHAITGTFQQGIGGHGGSQSQFSDGCKPRAPLGGQKIRHGRHGRVSRAARLLRQHFAHQQTTIRRQAHQVCEGAATIHPEAPIGQRAATATPRAASSTQSRTRG